MTNILMSTLIHTYLYAIRHNAVYSAANNQTSLSSKGIIGKNSTLWGGTYAGSGGRANACNALGDDEGTTAAGGGDDDASQYVKKICRRRYVDMWMCRYVGVMLFVYV